MPLQVPASSPAHYSSQHPLEPATDQQISEGPYVAQPGLSTTPMQPIHHGGIQNVHPYGEQPLQQMSGGVHSAHPDGAQPGPSTTPMQPIHNGEIQNMHPYQTNGTQYAYSNGAQPGPSTAPMQPTHNGEIQNIYPYGAQPSARSSTTPTQESQNAMSSGEHRRNVRSRSEQHEMPIPQVCRQVYLLHQLLTGHKGQNSPRRHSRRRLFSSCELLLLLVLGSLQTRFGR